MIQKRGDSITGTSFSCGVDLGIGNRKGQKPSSACVVFATQLVNKILTTTHACFLYDVDCTKDSMWQYIDAVDMQGHLIYVYQSLYWLMYVESHCWTMKVLFAIDICLQEGGLGDDEEIWAQQRLWEEQCNRCFNSMLWIWMLSITYHRDLARSRRISWIQSKASLYKLIAGARSPRERQQ